MMSFSLENFSEKKKIIAKSRFLPPTYVVGELVDLVDEGEGAVASLYAKLRAAKLRGRSAGSQRLRFSSTHFSHWP